MRYLLIIPCFLSLTVLGQSPKHFTISGQLNNLKDGNILFLEHNNENGGSDTVGSTIAKNNKFSFSGKVAIEAEPFFIKIDTVKTKYKDKIIGMITILMENTNVELTGDINDLSIPSITVIGSPSHNDFLDYYRIADSMMAISNGFLDQINTAAGKGDAVSSSYFQKQYDDARSRFNKTMTEWIEKNPNSFVTPWLIDQIYRGNPTQLQNYYDKLTARSQNSKFGMDLIAEIRTLQKTTEGKIAPDFEFPNQDGKNLSLKEVVQQSKFTILEFWASWCAPCLDEFPNMKKIYTQYHDKGLNILGYSVDDKEINWREALKKNNLPWYNIRETSKSFAENMYGVNELPQTYVLNNQGQIIAKGLIGEALQKKIEELINN